VVPNIENSFDQVAIYENDRLVKKSIDFYDQNVSEALSNRLPCDSNSIKEIHRQFKTKSLN